MKLSISERLTLISLLPEENSYAGIREIHRLGLLLGLKDDEAQQVEVQRLGDGRIQWNQEKALGLIVDVPIGEWMHEVVRMRLRDMDKAGNIRPEHMSLFEKFIFDYE
jgi:hypothetical protein